VASHSPRTANPPRDQRNGTKPLVRGDYAPRPAPSAVHAAAGGARRRHLVAAEVVGRRLRGPVGVHPCEVCAAAVDVEHRTNWPYGRLLTGLRTRPSVLLCVTPPPACPNTGVR